MEVKPGFKQTEIGIFPEDWEISSLLDVFKPKQGLQFPIEEQLIEYKTGYVRFIRIIDVTQGDQEIRYVKDPGAKHHVDSSDLFMIRYGNPGLIGSGYTGVIANNMFRLIPKKKVSNLYFYYLLLTKQKFLFQLASSTTMAAVNFTTLKAITICYPKNINEQNEIADFIKQLDILIDSHEKLIAKKKLIKQGVMQELLTGKRRLPGFTNEWKLKEIGQIADIGRGRVISYKEINNSNTPVFPVYSSQTTNDGIMGFIDTFDFDGEYATWTTDGVYAGRVFYRRGKFNCTNVCGTIRFYDDDCKFFSLLLNSITHSYVSKQLANPKLMNDIMKKIKCLVPSIAEQRIISQIITDLEVDITKIEKKRDKYQLMKHGMMQELLTGRIRLV